LFALLLIIGGFLLTRSGDPKTTAGERRVSETTATTQPNLVTTAAGDTGETTLPPATPPPGETAPPVATQPPTGGPAPTPPPATPPPATQPRATPTAPTAPAAPTTLPPTTTTTLPPLPPAQLSRTPADIFLPLPYPSVYKLQSITIAPGTWTVYSKGTAVNFGPAGDFVRCTLWNATANPPAQLDYATDWVGPTAQTRVISNVIQLTVSVPTIIEQKCQHDGASGNQAKIDRVATLVAFPARFAADQVWAVSPGDTFLGTNTSVANISLGAGTWLVGFKATGVKLDAVAGNVNCKPDAPSSNSAGVTVGGGPTASTMTGYTMVSGPTTVSLLCTGPAGSKTDPRATLWAYKVAGGVRTTGACNTTTSATAQLLLVNYGTCTVSGGGVHTKGAALRATVGAGTWVWLGAEGLISSANDFGRCGTFADGLGSGGATQVHPGRLAMNNLGSLLTFSATTNVDIACAADSSTITHGGTHVLLKMG
ncbi:MAG TPA: hypothetical protein VF855_04555, partial [Acidimicrobiales bacterium]